MRILADSLPARVTGNLGNGLVDVENDAVEIGDRDAFDGAAEHLRRLAGFFLCIMQLGDDA